MRSTLIVVLVGLVAAGCSAEKPGSPKDCADASRFVLDARRAYIEVSSSGDSNLRAEAEKVYETGKYWRAEACARILPNEFWSDRPLR